MPGTAKDHRLCRRGTIFETLAGVVEAAATSPRIDVRGRPTPPSLAAAASRPVPDVLAELHATADGLTSAQAATRLAEFGPNAVRSHGARWPAVLLRQLRSPLLVLLTVTATASFFVGERTDAVIIGAILALSIGLGFVNEFRAERAAEALHEQIRHTAIVVRDGAPVSVDVTAVVPGDVVDLEMGAIVPADLRLLATTDLECDEAVITGESLPVSKTSEPVSAGAGLADLASCALMGTVVRAGTGRGVVVATGARTQFGEVALALGERLPETEFQAGLRAFSMLLVQVAAVLTTAVFAVNVALHRPVLEAMLFALAIAVGVTPQLLPAVVSTSLSAGSRQLARHKVLVKRLLCIEDLGNAQVLCTDKTGTLTQGRISFMRSLDGSGDPSNQPLVWGLLCTESASAATASTGAHVLDNALRTSPAAAPHLPTLARWQTVATLPFDHERRLSSVVVHNSDGRRVLVTKGAPETVLARCVDVSASATSTLDAEFAAGGRVVAVATRAWSADDRALTAQDEQALTLAGFLVFVDAPKTSARHALQRLHRLGIEVKVITGDNGLVAEKVCRDLDLVVRGTLTGAELEAMDDAALTAALPTTTVFGRVSPEQKSRIVRLLRHGGHDVAFLGDGVNDAVALHAADVGIAVDDGADVAKDAADIILLEKDLDVLADGVVIGRRVFANTIKYLLMGTSSNFGNMFSAAGASAILSFLPMLPSQVLLNNLLYDTSQLAIPTDEVDEEQLARPAHWDIRMLRHYMLFFGPISSVFDFATFGVLLWGFNADASFFRTGWFIESLATQTLVIFVIRTRRTFFRSRPSVPLLVAGLTVVLVGAVLPMTPLAHDLGFAHPTGPLIAGIVGMVVGYLLLVEVAKQWFFRATSGGVRAAPRRAVGVRRVHRRAARFSSPARVVAAGHRRTDGRS